jgi:DNA modification methylase
MSHIIHTGSNLDVLPTLPDNSIDAIVTDPPYELGFMGKSWDSTGIAYNVALWKECLRVLKPGGHLLAFSGSRTYHRMTCAIEDAGFEIRDQMMWVYGSGFPKSHNISKAMDKANGVEREDKFKGAFSRFAGPTGNKKCDKCGKWLVSGSPCQCPRPQDEAKSPEAKQWEGWGTALKPAHEPICLARKPIEGTVSDNVLKWGVGGLNIDGCRVEYQSDQDKENAHYNALGMERLKIEEGEKLGSFEGGWKKHKPTLPKGRFPANLMHDGSQEVLDLFPSKAGAAAPVKSGHSGESNGIYNDYAQRGDNGATFYGDKGSAARFFYCPKASKADRDEGCEALEDKEWKTDGACIPERSDRPFNPSKNNHPTVKPTELMRYLCRLITPPGGTVLDPFNGSGSTGKAAVLEGFNYVGIELNPEYVAIAEARIKANTKP